MQLSYIHIYFQSAVPFIKYETKNKLQTAVDSKYNTPPSESFKTDLNCNYHVCNETKLTHYLSSVYSVTTPLHVSGLLVANHQKVAMYICDNLYMLHILVDC
jgi:hypothetical protein